MIFDSHTHWDSRHERNEEGIRHIQSLGVEKIIAFGPGGVVWRYFTPPSYKPVDSVGEAVDRP